MALIKLGGLAQDVRGSLNGTVFSRNKGGAYTRTKVSPVQPVTTALANTRQSFKLVSQAWAESLTDAERAGWIAFATTHPYINVFGDSIVLSGIAFFQASAKRLQQLGFPIIADSPVTWDVDPPGEIAPTGVLTAGALALEMNCANPYDVADQTCLVYATKKIPNGAQPQRNMFRLINFIDGVAVGEDNDFGPEYTARFDPYLPAIGDKIAVLVTYLNIDTGAISVSSMKTLVLTGTP